MSEEKNKNLTPEQQQAADATNIQARFGATDALERISAAMKSVGLGPGSGPGGFYGKTNFEGAQLNAMLDLLEAAKPEDLESAGDALEKAVKALNDAAKELDDYVRVVEWKGVSGTEFRRFGGELAKYAYNLATFANVAGAQMKVASTGLASVRNSKPPRDTRPDPKKAQDFPPTERTADNQDYQKALKAERDRQEAINQMNRLASFYAVSEQTLATQEPPKFPPMLKADVPQPTMADGRSNVPSGSPATLQAAERHQGAPARADRDVTTAVPPRAEVLSPTPPPTNDPSVQIDTVTAPPTPTTPLGTPPAQPVTPPTNNPTGPVPPMAPGYTNPLRPTAPKTTGPQATPRTAGPTTNPVGRPGVPGGGPNPGGQRGGPIGRAGTTGQPNVMGRPTSTPGGTTGGRSPIVGRPTATGQPPVGRTGTPGRPTGQPPVGRTGTPGPAAGRGGGIVGGTPQQRAASGSTGSRIPRGTVIGGQTPAPGRGPTARPSQSGVIGANPAVGANRPTGRGTPSVNGVVGTPRRKSEGKEPEESGAARPDYLTEDEETWTPRRRGPVPPVID
ncbi:hypothetical protein ACFPM3_14315 [Streptomyces coeruleoprunus]|uniref:Uncharacterized protein n=1 Tax=Streptomyces coeruleoprunus TaxID=285563 RepID=A0ABV9XCY8_9ACTN